MVVMSEVIVVVVRPVWVVVVDELVGEEESHNVTVDGFETVVLLVVVVGLAL